MSQEECAILRESVSYVKLYRYNPKHLYPKLNGYGDNGQRILKLWQLLHTYWLPNTYWNWQEYVVSVMLISVLNIKVTCEWHKVTKLNYKTLALLSDLSLGFQVLYADRVILWHQSYRAVKRLPRSLHYELSLPAMRIGWVWRHGRRTVRGHTRSPHFSLAIISVTVQLWI